MATPFSPGSATSVLLDDENQIKATNPSGPSPVFNAIQRPAATTPTTATTFGQRPLTNALTTTVAPGAKPTQASAAPAGAPGTVQGAVAPPQGPAPVAAPPAPLGTSNAVYPVTTAASAPRLDSNADKETNYATIENHILGGKAGFVPEITGAAQTIANNAAGQQQQVAGRQMGLANSSEQTGNAFGGYLADAGAGIGALGGTLANRSDAITRRTDPTADFGLQTAELARSGSAVDRLLALEDTAGPSAAQAQLQSGLNAIAAANRSNARSGRGYGGDAAAQSEASLNTARAGADVGNAAAVLRANEDAAARQRAASNLTSGANLQQSAAAQLGNQAQASVQNALQSRQVNDAAAAQNAGLALQGLTSGANTVAQGGSLALGGQGQAGQLATAAGAASATGAQQQQNALTFAAQTAQAQLQANQSYEQAALQELGIRKDVAIQNQAQQNALIGAGISAAGSLAAGGAMALSDVRAKDRVKPMSAVEALLSPEDSLLDERTGEELDDRDDPYALDYGRQSAGQAETGRFARSVEDAGAMDRGRMPRGSSSYDGPDADEMASHMRSGEASKGRYDLEQGRQLAKRRAGFERISEGVQSFAGGFRQQPRRLSLRDMPRQTAYAPITSDEREKTDLRPARGYSYEYKDPARHGRGRFYGPMAQDLLKTPAGRSAVVEQPDGSLGVDTGRLSLTNTSAIGEQQQRTDDVDERVSALERLLAEDAEDQRGRRLADNSHLPKGWKVTG